MAQRDITYLKSITETGDALDQTLFTDLIDTFTPFESADASLGTFSGVNITLDTSGIYSRLTMGANLAVNFTGTHIEGKQQILPLTTVGSYTLTFSSSNKVIYFDSSITNGGTLPSGNYLFYFMFVGNEIQIGYISQSSVSALNNPTLTSATIENATDSVLDLVFDEAVTITTAGWNIDTDGAALSISSVLSGSGTTTPKFQLSRSVLSTETLNVDYNSVTGNTVSVASGLELETFADTAVTNNVAAAFSNTKSGSFNGSTAYVTSNAQPIEVQFSDGANDSAFSISVWVKISSLPGGTQRIISQGRGAYDAYELIILSNGTFWIALYDGSATQYIVCKSSFTISTNTWTLITATYDGSGLQTGLELYKNDTIDASPTKEINGGYLAMYGGTSTDRLNIGRHVNTTSYFSGLLDECAIWSKELSGAEVTEILNSGTPGNLLSHSANANLEFWCRFEDDVTDNSTNSIATTNNNVTFNADAP